MPLIIDDSNWKKFEDDMLARNSGVGAEERDFTVAPMGSLPGVTAYTGPLIPRHEWRARIEEREAKKQTLRHNAKLAGKRIKRQSPTNYCWMNCVANAIEMMAILSGVGYIPMSPASAAARIKNFRNVGGWPADACSWVSQNGINTEAEWPPNAIDRRYLTEKNIELAKRRRLAEWWDCQPKSFDVAMTMALMNYPCPTVYMRIRHAMLGCDPKYLGGETFGIEYEDSNGKELHDEGYVVFTEPYCKPDDIIACRSINIMV